MLHHINQDECPACGEKINEACEYLRSWFGRARVQFPNVHISWSYRNKADQQKAYDDGLSRKQYPDSAHNHTRFSEPYSLALDLFQLSPEDRAIYDMAFYTEVAQWCVSHDEPIIWGGNYKTFKDYDHFGVDCSKIKI